MSDEIPQDLLVSEYTRLRALDPHTEAPLLLEKAKAAVQAHLDAKPGKGESFVRGAAQGGACRCSPTSSAASRLVRSAVSSMLRSRVERPELTSIATSASVEFRTM